MTRAQIPGKIDFLMVGWNSNQLPQERNDFQAQWNPLQFSSFTNHAKIEFEKRHFKIGFRVKIRGIISYHYDDIQEMLSSTSVTGTWQERGQFSQDDLERILEAMFRQ